MGSRIFILLGNNRDSYFYFNQVHTSGHAEIDTLKKVVKKLKPGKIIPIHTFHPDKYSSLFNRKIVQVSDGEVFVVQENS
ncbi:MAG TPA: hypothetical protein DCK79_09370 [Candidatus Atribacteria bacterium]|nr:hypothetical protein [Candidatus Atribacteria bacterium]